MKKIGFFDSGLGGLSVLRHAPTRINDAQFFYVADSAYAPYGEKPESLVLERSLQLADFFLKKEVDALVIACNTATAVAAEEVRSRLSIPVVAMEPAIKPGILHSQTQKIVVLATKATLKSERYKNLKDLHNWDGKIEECICHEWVTAVESGNLSFEESCKMVKKQLDKVKIKDADTYILGCTHFPFLEKEIKQILNKGIRIIDPSLAVIEQLMRILRIESDNNLSDVSNIEFYTSGSTSEVEKRTFQLLNWQIKAKPLD